MKKIRKLLFEPTKFFGGRLSFGESLKWYAISSLLFSLLFTIANYTAFVKSIGFVSGVLVMYLSTWMMYIIVGGLITLAALSFGAKKIKKIFAAFSYSMIPLLLFGWIPVIGLFFVIWSLSLAFIGISKIEKMEYGKASLAVSIAVFIFVLIFMTSLAYV